MAKVNLLSYHLYHNCDGDGDGDGDSEVDCDGVLSGGVLKRVNLVIFFLKADSISFKGIYPGYKNKKTGNNAFDPWYARLLVFKFFFYKCWEFFVGPPKKFLKCPEKILCNFFLEN